MTTSTELGMNRTGVATSPKLTAEMLKGQEEFAPDYPGDERRIASSRSARTLEWDEPLGSVPPPPSLKGVLKAGMTVALGESPTLLIDRLSARLSFERTGVRLYEALIAKYDAIGSFKGGPTREELEGILQDEFEHFRMLIDAVKHLGADPTVMTPYADLQATISSGALQVLVEPRTNLAQCLEAALTIELLDNDSWEVLISLTAEAGQKDLTARFTQALEHEHLHLHNVRRWLAAAQKISLPAG